METYPDPAAFCRTASYQQWLAQWRPPAEVELWVDHQDELVHRGPGHWTPRYLGLARTATRLPFYLLHSLDIGAERCVDIGCGHNWFRDHHPHMWGVDPHCARHRDEELTPAWWIPNWGQWPRALSICSLHFCAQGEIAQQVGKVRGLLAPGGRAMVALNRARIRGYTRDYQEELLRCQLAEIPGLTRMVWMDAPGDAWMDGNVWLWLESRHLVA